MQNQQSADQAVANNTLSAPVAHIGLWTSFLYILFFISLFVLAISTGSVLNAWVDKTFPNPILSTSPGSVVDYYALFFSQDDQLRGYIAAMLVSYPLFLVFGFVLRRQLQHAPMVRNLRSRKVLIYITLIIAFLIMLTSVIHGLYDLLGGSFTNNTLAHLLVNVAVSGIIFWYFLTDINYDKNVA